jgi:hypothetical protein
MAPPQTETRVRFSEIRIPPEEAVALAVLLLDTLDTAWRHKRAAIATQMFRARRDVASALEYDGGLRDLLRSWVRRRRPV